MPPVVLNVRQTDDRRDLVHRAVQALAEGQVIGIPSESGYLLAASAHAEAAVEKLADGRGHHAGRLFLAIRGADELLDYVPDVGRIGRRLAARGWPGPLTLRLPCQHPETLVQHLPNSVRAHVAYEGQLNLRVPAQSLIIDILQLLIGPVVLSNPAAKGESSLSAQELQTATGDQIPLILDDGPPKYQQPATWVATEDDIFEVLEPGVFTNEEIQQMASLILVFVCTGNTCRSPMAEQLCRHLVARKLGCAPEDLPQRGVLIRSAGVAAMSGAEASPEAVRVLHEMGLDLSEHGSRPLTQNLIYQADQVLVMTQSHRQAILQHCPDAAEWVTLLSPDQTDVTDPIGGTLEMYRQCAAQIESYLHRWIERWDL